MNTDSGSEVLLDARTRGQLRRYDPWEVRGAHEWARKMRERPELTNVNEAQLVSLAPLGCRGEQPMTIAYALRSSWIGRVVASA